jgi:hypothetical protein
MGPRAPSNSLSLSMMQRPAIFAALSFMMAAAIAAAVCSSRTTPVSNSPMSDADALGRDGGASALNRDRHTGERVLLPRGHVGAGGLCSNATRADLAME